MSDNTQRHHERVEAPQPQRQSAPDLKAGQLLTEGRQLFAQQHNAGGGAVSADGKQLNMSDPYAPHGGGRQHLAMAGDPASSRDGGLNALKVRPMGDHIPEKDVREANKLALPADPGGQPADKGGQPTDKGGDKPAQNGDQTNNTKAADLFNKDTTDQQKLAAVRDLANSGVTGMTYKDASGNEHNVRLEVEKAGNRQMVHMFEKGADGKERTVLRGVSNADGSFEQEKDRSGNSVDYRGRGYDHAMNGDQSNVKPDQTIGGRTGQPGDQTGRPDQPPRPDQIPGPHQLPDLTINGVDRSQFDSQLKDPRVMAAFAGRMRSEVGSQGHEAQVAFAEEVMNRAASRNQTLMQALSGSYYPTRNPGYSNNPEYINAIKTAWHDGTDITHGATGNASGRVGFGRAGGHYEHGRWVSPNQTFDSGGERFGYEQVDLNRGWMAKYEGLKARGSIASRERQQQHLYSYEDGRV